MVASISFMDIKTLCNKYESNRDQINIFNPIHNNMLRIIILYIKNISSLHCNDILSLLPTK
eukprot:UN05802